MHRIFYTKTKLCFSICIISCRSFLHLLKYQFQGYILNVTFKKYQCSNCKNVFLFAALVMTALKK